MGHQTTRFKNLKSLLEIFLNGKLYVLKAKEDMEKYLERADQ